MYPIPLLIINGLPVDQRMFIAEIGETEYRRFYVENGHAFQETLLK